MSYFLASSSSKQAVEVLKKRLMEAKVQSQPYVEKWVNPLYVHEQIGKTNGYCKKEEYCRF